MKKFALILISFVLCLSLAACTATSTGSKNYDIHAGLNAVTGYEYLYYDRDTKIVYLIFNECAGYQGYGYMSPYYAPNGLPYLYDANSQTLYEINVTGD